MIISNFAPVLPAFPLKILYLARTSFIKQGNWKGLVILFYHCSHIPDTLSHSYASFMQPNVRTCQISSPSMALVSFHIPKSQLLAHNFPLGTFYVHNSSPCPCALEEKCRLEALEINAQWERLSTNSHTSY